MYNPEGQDNNKEYIELKTDLNLTGFIIQDCSSEDILELIKYFPSNYSLIVEEGFNHTNINTTVYSVGTTIGNGLNNPEDIVIIKNGTEILDAIHYFSEWGAGGNKNSLCLIENNWQECPSTPGLENLATLKNYSIKINEFLPDPEGYDDAPMPEGEWIELINSGDPIDLEWCHFKDKGGRTLNITMTNSYNTTINDYLVIYTNGLFGLLNNEGSETLYLYDPFNNLIDEVSYDSSTEGMSWSKVDNIWRQTAPTPNKENENNKSKLDSEIKIEKVYLGTDSKAKFGDNIRIKLNVYKGNTSKTSISIWLEDNEKKLSKRTRFNVQEKFKEQSITVPLQIFPNCNQKTPDGKYRLKLEGLNSEDSEEIKVEGMTKNLCEEIKTTIKEKSDNKYSETIINDPNSTIDIIYESTGKKTEKTGALFFCFVLIFVIIQLTMEKWKK
jgi:hypothetical protein